LTSAKYIGTDVHKESISIAVLIATIVLIVWKRGLNFDAQYLKPAPSLDFLWRWRPWTSTRTTATVNNSLRTFVVAFTYTSGDTQRFKGSAAAQ
jgi:hypothetical protein